MLGTLAPVSVALKFGFLAVLYLFLLWVSRSALRDLRAGRAVRRGARRVATGFHSATQRRCTPPTTPASSSSARPGTRRG